jgi:PhnB protein
MSSVKPIPEGYHSVTPYLYVKGAAGTIDYYKDVFDATEVMRIPGTDGRIGHAELKIGDSIVMLADEHPEMGVLGPRTIGGVSSSFLVYIENVDAVVEKAVASGAKLLRPVQNQFYGDRSGTLLDPFGHKWTVSTHVEDVSPEELKKRAAAAASQSASA